MSAPPLETTYAATTDNAARRRIQAAVVAEYRPRVASLVRRIVCLRAHWREAEHVGAIGVLVALERYDGSLGVPFWAFARLFVKDEIQRWIDVGVHWRRRTRKVRPGFDANAARAHQQLASLDAALYDTIVAPVDSVETVVAEAEARRRLRDFAATLTPEEREILFSDNSQRVRSRRYLSLVERATAFVKGCDDGD